ncbi:MULTISPECIES: zinc transporter ZupT [unclassified Gemella]|uniref:zinc transporter ZupT n=1 Tax=unclassified Gemella TaxID=2624949 RepID=UPI001073C5D7|nr:MULTISPECIES: zinc transporter ZupT [unclassified Gemella]MBF0710529.1 zinc transporter ZupT [Gemella sp. GL1.1]MBF0747206.1 zinc transporter ZupT [Gemella sp. 19428wG2_WT2a]NYS27873.1 zinc transporter ZupT [Gemella sp. GL1]TFU58002.1 zinc transporter ZupT [Gemella sp. WT2a]
MPDNFLIALLLTIIAGLSTGIGSLIGLLSKSDNKNFLSVSLGFSAGVMIYVSMIEIFPKAKASLSIELGHKMATIATTLAFFAGILIIALIDKLIPSEMNPHEIYVSKKNVDRKKLMKMGLMTATALGIHNFPEGLATFVSALDDPGLALPIVVAIAIHNIPEGLAVSVPIYQATGSRKKAFKYSFLSGLAEPAGALIGWFILMPFMSTTLYGLIFASVAGIMVFISLDELLPAAHEFGEHHLSIYGLISGMALMAISLLLFL